MSLLVLWLVVGLVAAVPAFVTVALTWHVHRCRRQAATRWERIHAPLPAGPLPTLYTNPDLPHDDPRSLPFWG
ncbi:hypothetical protein FB384_004875 [Prauserella sediminis]|uniref:Uncharacterized protein n=1 Tax=Prauserella sediminis TaxID=577680 RepID=A0A839Y0V7_9PSEU|nr:hypothetical protein [Prauserella sediminis]MBB3665916.1 hypothetical protein [Prauserella sediminis]